MSLVTNWITKLPRLKNSKVARFSYNAEAYANDDIEGVENYDYSRDMNVPLATHTDFDPDMLSIGARTNFSTVPKNGLNHFFGRVSYNLNKVIDFLSDFLDDFISFTEIISFSSSATLANYADGTTKRLLNTAGSTITITLPAGETYLGSNTILLAPSIMLTITKIGAVWINSSGNAITADRWKTARNVTISDADGTNTGTAVSVDGSENETLKLPSMIKAAVSFVDTNLTITWNVGSADADSRVYLSGSLMAIQFSHGIVAQRINNGAKICTISGLPTNLTTGVYRFVIGIDTTSVRYSIRIDMAITNGSTNADCYIYFNGGIGLTAGVDNVMGIYGGGLLMLRL